MQLNRKNETLTRHLLATKYNKFLKKIMPYITLISKFNGHFH